MKVLLALLVILVSLGEAFYNTRSSSPDVRFRLLSTVGDVQSGRKTVCIVGGGFGGLYTALSVERQVQDRAEVVLIDPKDKFIFLPLLYELAVESASILEVAPLYTSLLQGTKVKFVQGAVDGVDLESRQVKVAIDDSHPTAQRCIHFDQLVVACGAQPRLSMIPGAVDHAIPFYRIEDAHELKLRLRALQAGEKNLVRVVIIGGGYSGVEVATSVAEFLGDGRAIISLVDRNAAVMHTAPKHNREAAEQALLSKGVSINCNTAVMEVRADGLMLQQIGPGAPDTPFFSPADLVICTSGVQPNPLLADLSLRKDNAGRLITSRTLQSVDNDRVFALGDCSVVDGQPAPSTAQVAMQQASIAARNVVLRLEDGDTASSTQLDTRLERFSYVPLGEMLTLGLADAAISGLGETVEIAGPLAALGRRLVYAARMPTTEQRVTAVASAGIFTASKILSMFRGNGKSC